MPKTALRDKWWEMPSLEPSATLCIVQINGTGELGWKIGHHPHASHTMVVQFMDGSYREVATCELRDVQSIDEWCRTRASEYARAYFDSIDDSSGVQGRDDVSIRAIATLARDAMLDAIERYAVCG